VPAEINGSVAFEFSDTAGWEAWLRIGKRHSNVGLITITDAGEAALFFTSPPHTQPSSNEPVRHICRHC
jgi:hypothetical protein